jgi:hypothetical protein
MRRSEKAVRGSSQLGSRPTIENVTLAGAATKIGIVLALAVALVSGVLLVELWKPPESVGVLIEKIRAERKAEKRTELAERLARLVQSQPNAVSGEHVASLTAMLGDDADSVRAWIAGALGFTGSRAVSSIPALEAARRKQAEADRRFPVSLSSVAAIDLALRRIRGPSDAGSAGSFPPWTVEPLYVVLDAGIAGSPQPSPAASGTAREN